MRILLNLLLLFSFANANAQLNVERIRADYTKAFFDKKICAKNIAELKANTNAPIFLGYLGGFQTIWANHIVNPFLKLKTFNQGKKNIEEAIRQDTGNVELRYIRLSVQKNAPFLLGYHANVDSDSEFLMAHRHQVGSKVVLENMEKLLNK